MIIWLPVWSNLWWGEENDYGEDGVKDMIPEI